MNRSSLPIIFVCWFIISATAQSADEEPAWPKLDEERNAHFLLSFGRTDIKGNVFHHQGSMTKIQGGYRFSDFVAIEIGLVAYGEAKDIAGTAEQEIVGAAIEGQLFFIAPLLNWFEPYVKFGLSNWLFDVNQIPTNIDAGTGEFEGYDLIYGAGIMFNVDHDSTLRLEYEGASFKDSGFDVDLKAISFGIQHRF